MTVQWLEHDGIHIDTVTSCRGPAEQSEYLRKRLGLHPVWTAALLIETAGGINTSSFLNDDYLIMQFGALWRVFVTAIDVPTFNVNVNHGRSYGASGKL